MSISSWEMQFSLVLIKFHLNFAAWVIQFFCHLIPGVRSITLFHGHRQGFFNEVDLVAVKVPGVGV